MKTSWIQVLKDYLADIVADTAEVQVSLADGGFTDLLLDAIKAETALIVADTNEVQVSLADGGFTDLLIDAIKAETALIVADTNEIQVSLADGGFTDLLIDAIKAETVLIKAQTDKIAGKMLFSMDFWSLPQEEVAVTGAAGDKALPSVTVGDLPGDATIVRAIAMFKFRMVENHTYAGVNSLDGAQEIQVEGAVDAINFVTGQFTLAETTREGGDVVIGVIDIAATVNANGAYAFHWDLAKALQTGINFNDVQCGIRLWYSV